MGCDLMTTGTIEQLFGQKALGAAIGGSDLAALMAARESDGTRGAFRLNASHELTVADQVAQGKLDSIIAKLIAGPATEVTLNSILSKLIAGPATEITLNSILSKLIARPATEAKQDSILAKLIAAPSTESKQDAANVLLAALSNGSDNLLAALGAQADAAAGSDTATASQIALLKRLLGTGVYVRDPTTGLAAAISDRVNVVTRGLDETYSGSKANLTPAASCTALMTLTGTGSNQVHVTRVWLAGVANTAIQLLINLVRRSTSNSGTATTTSGTPHASANTSANATFRTYAANPTLGNSAGTIRCRKVLVPAAGGTPFFIDWIFGAETNTQPIILIGTGEVLEVNLTSTTIDAGDFCGGMEWFKRPN